MTQPTPRADLRSVELAAGDLATTKRFYTDALGWEWVDYGPTYAAARVTGVEVGINAEAAAGTEHAAGSQSVVGTLLLLETDDLDTAVAAVVEHGAEVTTEPFDFPGGSRFHFRDPAGNVLGIYVTAG